MSKVYDFDQFFKQKKILIQVNYTLGGPEYTTCMTGEDLYQVFKKRLIEDLKQNKQLEKRVGE